MNRKKDLISGILFCVYAVLFLLFVPTTFFGGQIIGGGVYFVCFAVTIAYFILDLKYEFSFKTFYRFFVYINDLIIIMAIAIFIYYGIHTLWTIFTLCIVSLIFFADLLCKDRVQSKDKANITANVANLLVMSAIFPYFFFAKLDYSIMLICMIVATITLVCKIILAINSYKAKKLSEEKTENNEIDSVIKNNVQDEVLE